MKRKPPIPIRVPISEAIASAYETVIVGQPPLEGSEKFLTFVAALKELCVKHGVCLSSSGYEGLQVWDMEPDGIGSEPIYLDQIEDRTKP